MAEPGSVPPVPPPAAPFSPTAPTKRPGPGCSKPLLIGCGSIGLLVGIALIFFFYLAAKDPSRLLKWSLNQMEGAVMARLPQDITPEERDRLKAAFANVHRQIDSGQVSPDQLQTLNSKFLEVSRKSSGLTREDIRELTEALEALGGPAETGTEGGAPPG